MALNQTKIRKRILIPMTLMMVIALLLIACVVYYLQQMHIDKEGREKLAEVEQVLPIFLKGEIHVLEALLSSLTQDALLHKIWASNNRRDLLLYAHPLFEDFSSRYAITHFYFIEKDKTCFLRVHDPSLHGDVIERFTVTTASQTGTSVSGLELGSLGTVTLRFVQPWKVAGEIIGYLELGVELGHIIPKLEKAIDVQLFVGLNKSKLDRDGWEQGKEIFGHNANWNQFDHVVSITNQLSGIPPKLKEYINLPHEKHYGTTMIDTEKEQFYAGQLPLQDVADTTVGEIFIFHNNSEEQSLLEKMMQSLMLITFVIIVFCGAAFYFFVGRIEKQLNQARNKLQQESDSHRQTADELRGYKENLENMVQDQTKALHETNRKLQVEVEERNNAEKAWERTYDAMADIVTIHDEHMRIVRANKATRQILGVEPEELIGKFCYEVFRGKSSPCVGCPEAKSQHDYTQHTSEIEHPKLNKTFLVSASPIVNESGNFEGVVHFAKDITDYKNLESQFIQAQKMEAVGRLSGGVAHDFNNLLTTMIGFSELALMELGDKDPLKENVEEILKAGKRATGLTRQLLAFSRKQVLEMEVVNLNKIVEDSSKMLRRLIGEDVELKVLLHASDAKVTADSSQIDQILMNLAVNARDAMPDGGTLIIETALIDLDEEYARSHKDVQAGPHVMLTVTDTGEGMSKEVQSKIFEPFFTTKERGKGTGLGLATIFGIVKQHKGHIFIYSELGRGTTFKIYFPMASGDALEKDTDIKLDKNTGTETILVVDDEPAILNLTVRSLEPLGYQVLQAGSGEEAIELYGQRQCQIDLLLTDVIMQGMTGRQLAETLIQEQPTMKVVYMSGYTDEVISHKGVLEPGTHFINKPLMPTKLMKDLREILDSEQRKAAELKRMHRIEWIITHDSM